MKTPIISAFAAVLGFILTSGPAVADLQTETVEYQVDGETFTGYLAWDDNVDGERPGVLVVHEWWGHNDFARSQAEKLAAEGYTAFALDMYGSGKVADHPDNAQKFMEEATSDMEQVKARFITAMELLQEHETVDDSRIAAQGYCFGGAVVLNMARMGVDLDGVVSFHGALGSPVKAEAGNVKARVQVYTGGADPFVPVDQVANLVTEMQTAEVDLNLVSFPGAVHSFTNPGADEVAARFDMPLAFNEDAANRSWEGTLRFYQRIFAEAN
jgi:dienelactone hydrolase